MNLNYEKNLVNSPVATILISHIHSDTDDKYSYIINKLNEYNFNVYKHKVNNFYNLNKLTSDYNHTINLIKKENPRYPIFILAYDLSTYILLRYGSSNKNIFDGAILYSPQYLNNKEENITFEDDIILSNLYKFNYPSLILNKSHNDTNSSYGKFLFNNILSRDKEFNIFNNLNDDNSIEYICNWIKNRLV